MQDESARQHGWWKWKWKDLKSASLEIRKTIMSPKWLIYIPLNHKMAPASDWLFFCSSSVKIESNSPKVFRNWHAQRFEKCCTRFYLDWRRRRRIERRKLFLPDTACIEYFFYLLSSLDLHLLRLYLQCNDIIIIK